jgi:hypothetical protein
LVINGIAGSVPLRRKFIFITFQLVINIPSRIICCICNNRCACAAANAAI